MSKDKSLEQSESSSEPTSAGLKRRDLLLSGSSLVAASALTAVGLTTHAQAQQPAAAPAGQRPNIVVIMGDDIGMLHGGSRQLHHRRAADPHRHDHGRPGRRTHRPAGAGGDHCHCSLVPGERAPAYRSAHAGYDLQPTLRCELLRCLRKRNLRAATATK